MEFVLPVKGVEALRPLIAYLAIYLVILVFIRLLAWPAILVVRQGSLVGSLVATLWRLLLRLGLFALIVFTLLWALSVLGVTFTLSETVETLPWFVLPLPGIGELQISVVLLLLIILAYLIIRPIFTRVRRRKAR